MVWEYPGCFTGMSRNTDPPLNCTWLQIPVLQPHLHEYILRVYINHRGELVPFIIVFAQRCIFLPSESQWRLHGAVRAQTSSLRAASYRKKVWGHELSWWVIINLLALGIKEVLNFQGQREWHVEFCTLIGRLMLVYLILARNLGHRLQLDCVGDTNNAGI